MNGKFDIEPDLELDPAFAERDRQRKAGLPVEIARTKRLLIRETVMQDVPVLYDICRLPGMGNYLEPPKPTLEEELEVTEAYIRHAYAFCDFGLWTVLEQKSGRIVGRAGLFVSNLLENAVELGYMMAPDRQRMGYGVECGRAVVDYAKEMLDLTELHILTDVRNQASVRTAVKLGFAEQERIEDEIRELIHFKGEIS